MTPIKAATFPDDLMNRLNALYDHEEERFDVLVRACGLSPKIDFRNRDLTEMRFDGSNLKGFDFTNSDLRSTNLRNAAVVDRTTIFAGARIDADDAAWLSTLSNRENSIDKSILADFKVALHTGQLSLVFQPKVSLRDNSIIGAEALVRWEHPRRGLMESYRFLPEVFNSDLNEQFTFWSIETVLESRRSLEAESIRLPISLNVSVEMFDRPDFVENCSRLLYRGDEDLRFEVDERIFLSDGFGAFDSIEKLRKIGVSIAIDNYGTGFSPLMHLKHLPATELKIDHHFISKLTSENSDPLVVRSIIDLAHALNMEVTAQGVETSAQLALLGVMGCDAAQGFFISRPVGLASLVEMLRAPRDVPAWAAKHRLEWPEKRER